MPGRADMGGNRAYVRQANRVGLLVVGIGVVAAAVLQLDQVRFDSGALTVTLLIVAVSSGLTVVARPGRTSVSSSFLAIMVAAALTGPATTCACAALAELASAWRLGSRLDSVLGNLVAAMAPGFAAANVMHAWAGSHPGSARFYLVVVGAGVAYVALNFLIVAVEERLLEASPVLSRQVFAQYAPSEALNIGLALAGVGLYLKIGLGGVLFGLVAVVAFAYMAHLLEQSRQRAEQYVSLSWGVLGGLMRALDIRDQRAARHAAAVARFARDMAQAVGMSEHEIELAHTAGLLHDIGRFALSDRVFERGRTLTDEDWVAIQRHPELGAEMLKDLGLYGPVAEIVLSHHERIDGRGYPHGLTGAQIPEIAKIIAVAEIYDTLTASDTYRTRMSSFEALRELRRVAGSQVESGYVETLAGLLSGEGVDYRHADAVKFDAELDMERRIKEAGARG